MKLDPYILIVLFGVSSWVTINGIFSILPLIIDQVPEGWAIASTLGLAVSGANVGPLVYRLRRPGSCAIPSVIYSILFIGTLSMLGLACFWNLTLQVNGSLCSFALIAFTFTAALCDCTSSVVYWPFIGAFAPQMVPALALGENLSSVVASFVSWLGFSPSGSFVTLACVLLFSCVAFSKLQLAVPGSSGTSLAASEAFVPGAVLSPVVPYVVVGVTSVFENTVLPSVLPYTTARYSQIIYHVASTLPVGTITLLSLAFIQPSRNFVVLLTICSVGAVGFVVWAGIGAADVSGSVIVTMITISKALVAYCKGASMYQLKIGAAHHQEAQRHLEAAGGIMQVCSFSGAALMFWLTHYTTVFPK